MWNEIINFDKGTTVNEAASILGIDKWQAVKQPCFDKNEKPIDGLFYLENSETEEVITTRGIGSSYKESTHEQMLNFFKTLMENTDDLHLTSGIAIKPGSHIILNATWKRELEIDTEKIIKPNLIYVINHSGKDANRIIQMNRCLWCQNQLSMLLKNRNKDSISIRHSNKQDEVVKQVMQSLLTLKEQLQENLELYRLWNRTYITKDTFDQLVNALLETKDAKVENVKLYQQLENNFYYGDGSRGGKTLFDFINAVTEQLRDIDYKDITRKVKSELLGSSYNR
ncbi:MAG TPA: DUF932 domain-containing protein, partial [Allocoleopsis sp.]